MHLVTLLISGAILFSASLVPACAAPPAPAPSAPSAPATVNPAQIRLEMRLSRVDKGSAAADGAGNSPDSPVIATPALTTLDRGTATVSVTNKDLSYSISASPSIEHGEKPGASVQLLWNLRLSGRTLPEGTNSASTTGATRIVPDAAGETLLTELPIRDAKTGSVSVFRLTVRVGITRTPSDPATVPALLAPSSIP